MTQSVLARPCPGALAWTGDARRCVDHDGRRRPARGDALPARRRRAGAVPAGGAALPQGRRHRRATRPSTSGCATSTATRSAGSTCAAPVPARASRPTSTRDASRTTSSRSSPGSPPSRGAPGNVGMFGTSYSGFNSIQVAMRRPPALKAIVPIYATDDRYTDDVHYMGGARRLLDLIDYPTYMVAMNALPPVPARVRRRTGARSGSAGSTRTSRGCCAGSRSRPTAPYWRHGSLRPDYGRDHRRDDDRRRLGRRLPQQHLPDVRGA